MTDVFKRLAPKWRSVVRKYALDIWRKKDEEKADAYYETQAELFARRYKYDLRKYYEKKEIKIYRGTIDGKAQEWLHRQAATRESIKTLAEGKQEKLVADEFAKLAKSKSADTQKMLNRMFAAREGESVYRVFSFADNFEARAEQIGEETAFELGRDINEAVMSNDSNLYLWRNQDDARVRETHKNAPVGLGGLVFLFDDPPTTVDAYGHTHTGNPGTDWGCVIGSTRVIFDGDVKTLFRRAYTGKLTAIITPVGPLYLTPNHPMLTARGWVAAQDVKWFDKIVKIPGQMGQAFKSQKTNDVATAREVFDFFQMLRKPFRVSGSAEQFHGDGLAEHEINVIRANRSLLRKAKALGFEKFTEFFFAGSDQMRMLVSKSTKRDFVSKFRRLFLPGRFFIGGLRQFFALAFGHFAHAYKIRFTAGARANACGDNDAPNHKAANPEKLSTSQFTKTALIFSGDAPSILSYDFTRALCVIHFNYSGYVYNFETSTGVYYANRMASHNCRCFADEAPKGQKPKRNFTVREKKSKKR